MLVEIDEGKISEVNAILGKYGCEPMESEEDVANWVELVINDWMEDNFGHNWEDAAFKYLGEED